MKERRGGRGLQLAIWLTIDTLWLIVRRCDKPPKKEYKTWAASVISAWLAHARVSKYLHSYSQVTRYIVKVPTVPGTGGSSINHLACLHRRRVERDRQRESCKFYNIISDNFTHISHTHTHALQHSGQSTLHVFYDIQHRFIFYTHSPLPSPYSSKGFFLELIKHSGIFYGTSWARPGLISCLLIYCCLTSQIKWNKWVINKLDNIASQRIASSEPNWEQINCWTLNLLGNHKKEEIIYTHIRHILYIYIYFI